MTAASTLIGPSQPLDLRSVLELLGDAATPSATIASEGQSWSYAELWGQARAHARTLGQAGVTAGDRVALLAGREPRALAAILGLWMLGATYVPLDPEHPPERLALLLSVARPRLVALVGAVAPLANADCLRLEAEEANASVPAEPPPADAPAYMMFTSGSTGQPKGVLVSHRALANLLLSFARLLPVRASDRLFAVTTFSFDISLLELLLPLVARASLYLADSAVLNQRERLRTALEKVRPTLLQATPTRWRQLLECGYRAEAGARALSGGEPLPPDLAAALLRLWPVAWNVYGPTETTIWSTYSVLRPEAPIRLGQPLHNTVLAVVDEDTLEMAGPGGEGELWIAGEGLAEGYFQRPEENARAFVTRDSQRFYRTGDRVRRGEDGELEWLGRRDAQVKISGHRVELEEVEVLLRRHPDVADAAVVLSGGSLVASYRPRPGARVGEACLRDFLSRSLPGYAVPSRWRAVADLPVSPHGKLDRLRLAQQVQEGSDDFFQAFRDVLGAPQAGPDDCFRDLGGTSLHAVELARIWRDRFGLEVPLHVLFEGGTLREAASQARPCLEGGSPVCAFRKGTWPIPLVLAPTFTGGIPHRLAAPLPSELTLHFLMPSSQLATSDLARTARAYLPHLPPGPLVLAGYSYGGLLAYELAQQALQQGRNIRLLVMIDCPVPPRPSTVPWQRLGLARWRPNRWLSRRHLARLRLALAGGHGGQILEEDLATQLEAIPGFVELPEANRALAQVNLRAEETYQPRPYSRPVVLIRSRHRWPWSSPSLGWERLIECLEVHSIGCSHYALMDEPWIGQVRLIVESSCREICVSAGKCS